MRSMILDVDVMNNLLKSKLFDTLIQPIGEQVEDEMHLMLFCSKFKDLKILLFQRLNIHTHDLRPNMVKAFSVLIRQMKKEKKNVPVTIFPMQ